MGAIDKSKYDRAEYTMMLARLITNSCVRNTFLEDLHAGTYPSSKVGDYSDVKVVTPYGEIPWEGVSRISDKEMRELMLEIEDKIFKSLLNLKIDGFHKDFLEGYGKEVGIDLTDEIMLDAIQRTHFGPIGVSWDNPELDTEEISTRK